MKRKLRTQEEISRAKAENEDFRIFCEYCESIDVLEITWAGDGACLGKLYFRGHTGPHAEFIRLFVDIKKSGASFNDSEALRAAFAPIVLNPNNRHGSSFRPDVTLQSILDVVRRAADTAVPSPTLPDEIHETRYPDGAVSRILVNRYERNPNARAACLKHHGVACVCCEMTFGDVYGEDFDGYIHVHHLRPLAQLDGSYDVDPLTELVPVCPNCHAAIHQGKKLRSPDEVRRLVHSRRDEVSISDS